MVCGFLIYAGTVINDLRKELREVKATQERQVGKYQFDKWQANDIRMCDYIRLSNVIGEVYGLETEDEQLRLICWSLSITNGMPFAERRLRIRKGLDGDDWPEKPATGWLESAGERKGEK